MAPKRGGSSRYGGSSSSSTCPSAFADTQSKVYFACIAIFLVIYFAISVALCTVRKKTGASGKRLLGSTYSIALCFMILGYTLELIATVLLECDTVVLPTYYTIAIAMNIFYYLAYWSLLFVFVYKLNTLLREHLHHHPSTMIKTVLFAIVSITFAITLAQIIMTSYNLWTAGYDRSQALIMHPAEQLRTAWNVAYFLGVISAGLIATMSLLATRSSKQAARSLLPLTLALTVSMAIWIIIGIIFAASYLDDNTNIITFETKASLTYIQSFFQALSFVILLVIASHGAWTKTAIPGLSVDAEPAPNRHVYAYHAGGERRMDLAVDRGTGH